MRIIKKMLCFSFIFFLLVCPLWLQAVTKWQTYYEKSQSLPPNKLLVDHYSLFNNVPFKAALDLGAGVGNETAFLLNNGWRVIAIDSEPMSIEHIKKRKDVSKYITNLGTEVNTFEKLNWRVLPSVNLVVASYSLPFASPKDFPEIWKQLTSRINSGGYFVGEFFGNNYTVFSEKKRKLMTILTKEEVQKLFHGFKIVYFMETTKKTKNAEGKEGTAHTFEIIAKKL